MAGRNHAEVMNLLQDIDTRLNSPRISPMLQRYLQSLSDTVSCELNSPAPSRAPSLRMTDAEEYPHTISDPQRRGRLRDAESLNSPRGGQGGREEKSPESEGTSQGPAKGGIKEFSAFFFFDRCRM